MFIFFQLYETFISFFKTIQNKIDSILYEFVDDSDFLKTNKDYYNPDIPNNHLVLVEYYGVTLIGKVHNYELGNSFNSKMCYFTEEIGKPYTLLTKKNLKQVIGDFRLFVLKNENDILFISKIIKNRSLITLINVLKIVQDSGGLSNIEQKKIKKIYKDYRFRLNLLENSWTG